MLLLPNNCSDGTAAIANSLSLQLPFRLDIRCHTFPPSQANAGNARRMAMQYATELGGPDGVLLTTDADGVVAVDWIERNLLAIKAGAELVCGRVVLEEESHPRQRRRDGIECAVGRGKRLLTRRAREARHAVDRVARLRAQDCSPWRRRSRHEHDRLEARIRRRDHRRDDPALAVPDERDAVAVDLRARAQVRDRQPHSCESRINKGEPCNDIRIL